MNTLLSVIEKDSDKRECILTGLHCCGDLSCTLLKYFISDSCHASVLVLVGCCYNMLSVEGESNREGVQVKHELSAFPMSNTAKVNGIHFNRNARNLAVHVSSEHEKENFIISLYTLHKRSLLQLYIKDHHPVIYEGYKIPGNPKYRLKKLGKMKDELFSTYAIAALKKLKVEVKEEEVSMMNEYESKYKSRDKEAAFIFCLRF